MHLLARQVAGAELSVPLEHISITGWVHLIFLALTDFVVMAIPLAPEGRNVYSNAVD
jgi:hypothetical protein